MGVYIVALTDENILHCEPEIAGVFQYEEDAQECERELLKKYLYQILEDMQDTENADARVEYIMNRVEEGETGEIFESQEEPLYIDVVYHNSFSFADKNTFIYYDGEWSYLVSIYEMEIK